MSGLIPQDFITELVQRTDIVALIESYFPLQKQGRSYVACCPFHHEKTPSFNVISHKQFFHCFGCGVSGNVISFLMNHLHQSFVEAVDTLASRHGMIVPKENGRQPTQKTHTLFEVLEEAAVFFVQALKQKGTEAIEYLKNRGISGEIAKKFQIGFSENEWNALERKFPQHKKALITTGMLISKENGKTYDRYRNRIMFPIQDKSGRIIGFGGRSLTKEQTPKYLNSPETVIFHKNNELYGLNHVLHHQKNPAYVIVVEGYMDVIALVQAGIPEVVGTLGTAVNAKHFQILEKITSSIYFCFDGDNAGQKAAWRALEQSLAFLENGLEVKFIFLPEEHDPDSFIRENGKDAFLTLIQQSTSLEQFLFNTLAKDINLSTPSGKTKLIQITKPFWQKIPESAYKHFLLEELGRYTQMDTLRLTAALTAKESQQPVKAADTASAKTIKKSPLRLALAMLLEYPSSYKNIQSLLPALDPDQQGQKLLLDVCRVIHDNPTITSAGLIEYWRESPDFIIINQLATLNFTLSPDTISKELSDLLLFIAKQNRDQQIQFLVMESKKAPLSTEQKNQLKMLLNQKHALQDEH